MGHLESGPFFFFYHCLELGDHLPTPLGLTQGLLALGTQNPTSFVWPRAPDFHLFFS